MSNLLVQNIKHTNNTTSMAIDTSGQVTIRGEGSATTTNLQQGLSKMWGNHDGADRSEKDSLNVSSTSDIGTGAGSYTFTNNMNNALYCVGLGTLNSFASDDGMHPYGQISSGTFDSSTFRIDVLNYNNTNDGDCLMVWTQVDGDLA